jgi:hypothetical protein
MLWGVSAVARVAISVVLLTTVVASSAQPDPAQSPLIYHEPDDPVLSVLARAHGRIYSDDPKDYTEEASSRGLRELDEAIADRPDDPRLHWYRSLTLERMKRTPLARAAREQAIKIARICPAGDELIDEYYGAHAEACAKENDAAAAAAAFLARLDLAPHGNFYNTVAIWLGDTPRGDPKAPGPGPLFPGRDRLEALWGPLDRFFESHAGPANEQALEQVAKRVRVGMDYRDVAREVGFPDFNMDGCHWDHGIPVMDTCWWYEIAQPTIVRQGNLIGAVPPKSPTIVHVVIVDNRVKKVEKTIGPAPENKTYRHRERASFDCTMIGGVAFSPDGAVVAAGDADAMVHLYDVRAGRERSALLIPGVKESKSAGWLRAIAFAPDGKTLAVGGTYDATARLLDVASGRVLASLESFPVPTNSGRMDDVMSLAFAPDGKTLATAGRDRDLRLWDVATGRLRASLRAHSYDLTAVAYSPDGKTIASGDYDGNVRLWDLARHRPRARWPGNRQAVAALAFSPDGKTLAVARDNGVVRLRDLTADCWRIDLHHCLPTFGQILAFSPDSKTLIVAGVWDVATVWDTASGRMTGFLEGHAQYPNSVAYSPDGKLIATGAHDNTLKLWDAPAPPAPP